MTSETPLYIYAVCQVPEAGLTLPPGIEGDTMMVQVEEMGAIAEPGIDLQSLQADDQRLLTAVLTHDRVICELFQQGPLLPLRFGIQMTSMAGLEAHLRDNLVTYRNRLKALGDKAEYQVKLTPIETSLTPLPEGLKGRDYFLAKKARLQEQAAEQEKQQDDFKDLLSKLQSTYAYIQAGSSEEGFPRLYLLLDPSQAEHLLHTAEAWQRQTSRWQIALSEALPPYHFVS